MALSEVSKRVAARQQRLAAFPGEGTPPGDVACELLCEDHVGTYDLPYLSLPLVERRVAKRRNRRAGEGRGSGLARGEVNNGVGRDLGLSRS